MQHSKTGEIIEAILCLVGMYVVIGGYFGIICHSIAVGIIMGFVGTFLIMDFTFILMMTALAQLPRLHTA